MKRTVGLACALGLLLAGSAGAGFAQAGKSAADKKKSDLEEIKAMQQQILERLDAQDKLLKEIQQKIQAPAAAQRPQVDPNKVYAIPVPPEATIKGPKDARVTIFEFSDYQ